MKTSTSFRKQWIVYTVRMRWMHSGSGHYGCGTEGSLATLGVIGIGDVRRVRILATPATIAYQSWRQPTGWACCSYVNRCECHSPSFACPIGINQSFDCRYPEVLTSIFESHTFHFNDLAAAYWFFHLRPPPLVQHIRHLDITLRSPSYEYGPFLVSRKVTSSTQLSTLLHSLTKINCIHNLRLSFDVRNRESWEEVSESDLLSNLSKLRVLKRLDIELPPIPAGKEQNIEPKTSTGILSHVERRPPLRYWMSPGVPPMVQRVQRSFPKIPNDAKPW